MFSACASSRSTESHVELVVDEDVALGERHAHALGLARRDRIRRGPGIQEQQVALPQLGHQDVHADRVGGQERTHVVVDPDEAAKAAQVGAQPGDQLGRAELTGQRVRPGPIVAAWLHWHMHQQLVSGGPRRLGLGFQVIGVGHERQGERGAQSVERGGAAPVEAEIVDHHGDRRPQSRAPSRPRCAARWACAPGLRSFARRSAGASSSAID